MYLLLQSVKFLVTKLFPKCFRLSNALISTFLVQNDTGLTLVSGVKPHLSRYYKPAKGSRLSNTIISMFVMQNYTVLNIVS